MGLTVSVWVVVVFFVCLLGLYIYWTAMLDEWEKHRKVCPCDRCDKWTNEVRAQCRLETGLEPLDQEKKIEGGFSVLMYEAKIVADSVCSESRLTTMQLTHPRIVHAEFMTHCMFARNASSSRAIPFSRVLQNVQGDPFVPVHWGQNQKGMQAENELSLEDQEIARMVWMDARNSAMEFAKKMHGLGVHKQVVNRLLEPWSWITVCVTGDAGAWSNYFALRCHPDAQPDIQKQAYMAQLAYYCSKPKQLNVGQWHTPYILPSEKGNFNDQETEVMVSVGRCARTSYLTQEGSHDIQADLVLCDRLTSHTPMHASPLEHVAKAMGDGYRYAKYIGWKSYRHFKMNEYVTDFKPNHPDLVVKG